ncbi:MAG: hypothetical protein JWN34_4574 [Bryobacterales bacterium]|nr:hypothetical protein [Bryobacterales bacterium]
MDGLRAEGGAALHELCRRFVDALNERLSTPSLILDPPTFAIESFRDPGTNLFQINLHGRLLMIEFEATDEPLSTDDFRRPYILQGSIRGLNQDLLDRHLVSEKSLFFCPVGDNGQWHYVDNRSYRSGKLTADVLAAELERLV